MRPPAGLDEQAFWKLYARDGGTGRIVLSATCASRSEIVEAAAAQWKIEREPVQIVGPSGEQFYHEEITALIRARTKA